MMHVEDAPTMPDLLSGMDQDAPGPLAMARDAFILRGFGAGVTDVILAEIGAVAGSAPFRHMYTPSGGQMSASVTNCGQLGWISDRQGYRYCTKDPETGRPWPAMSSAMRTLSQRAAAAVGYPGFDPDACLITRYAPGARLSLHQDKNEQDDTAPIVSLSLGLTAIFLFGGARRSVKPDRYQLNHGDMAVWGRSSRLAYHGIAPLADGAHPATGRLRYCLTFRKAGR